MNTHAVQWENQVDEYEKDDLLEMIEILQYHQQPQ